jgi:hypothetical protein
MKIIDLIINEDIVEAELAFAMATSTDIIELCKNYLVCLNRYRDQLLGLKEIPEIDLRQPSSFSRELTDQARKAVRAAIEEMNKKRSYFDALLASFLQISGYEAAKTLNVLRFKGFDNWESYSGGVRLKYGQDTKGLTMDEAVKAASLLRREAYLENKTTFFPGSMPASA